MSAFWLALTSGAFHASWNALAKAPGRERAATVVALIISWLAAIIWWLFTREGTIGAAQIPWVVIAGLGEAAYVFSLGMAYARGDLAITYAVSRASAQVFIWPLSWLVFGSVPGRLALAATALIALGILFTRKKKSGEVRWSIGWTLLTGASVAIYHTGYKGAVGGGASQALAFIGAVTIAVPILLVLIGKVRNAVPALLRTPRMILAGILCAASFLLMLAALSTAESGRILGVRNASVGFALIIALAQGERLDARQWVGMALLFVGVAAFGFV